MGSTQQGWRLAVGAGAMVGRVAKPVCGGALVFVDDAAEDVVG
jgi:hypothetical protein